MLPYISLTKDWKQMKVNLFILTINSHLESNLHSKVGDDILADQKIPDSNSICVDPA
jgi:hypothetical protein